MYKRLIQIDFYLYVLHIIMNTRKICAKMEADRIHTIQLINWVYTTWIIEAFLVFRNKIMHLIKLFVLDLCCCLEPCQNGAGCIGDMHEYSCQCIPGFTGNNCETSLCVEQLIEQRNHYFSCNWFALFHKSQFMHVLE